MKWDGDVDGEPVTTTAVPPLEYGSRAGRLVLLATVLASGVAFLDATVVTVALPRIGTDLDAGLSALQWVLDGYLLTLGSLVLVGGALGDLLGRRRVFLWGMYGFAATSLACGLAPDATTLVAARMAQGASAALLAPASLAILSASFAPEDRGRAIGAWSGLSGVATAFGPFVGGWLVDAASWRWVFLLNLPLLAGAVVVTLTSVPEDRGTGAGVRGRELLRRVDLPGAALTVAGLALVVAPLIEAGRLPAWAVVAGVTAGLALLAGFVAWERRTPWPMLPPGLFRIRTFSVANVVTLFVYGALSAMSFLLSLALQQGLGWSALAAGAALFPITVVLLLFSPGVGALLPRVGARPLLTAGPLLAAVGLVLLARLEIGDGYVDGVLPGLLVFSVGLVLVVTPVTTTALTDVPADRQGVASGANNAVARVAGLLAIAVLPVLAGLTASEAGPVSPEALVDGVGRAMLVAAALCALGGGVAAVALRTSDCAGEPPEPHPTPVPCPQAEAPRPGPRPGPGLE